ncbi:hypothetical protein TNCV_1301561 [Trichonephila clavipes]|nr:hypothetical protein TNCV_1301561 [Trichonephila clavipes]
MLSTNLCGFGSLVVKVTDSSHEFEPCSTEDPPCKWGRCTLNMSRLKRPPFGVVWKLGEKAVRSAGCKCLPFLLVKSAREVPAYRFFSEKDKEEVSSVFTCNVKEARELKERQEARELKERQEARELKERQETRAYELERLRLSNATETVSVSSADLEGQGVNRRVNLKDLVPKFDAKNADINLFLKYLKGRR